MFLEFRGNNFEVDLEEVMLMEAIWLSIQVRQNKKKNRSSIVNLVSSERMFAMSPYCDFSNGDSSTIFIQMISLFHFFICVPLHSPFIIK
jgi:hypothetical protein